MKIVNGSVDKIVRTGERLTFGEQLRFRELPNTPGNQKLFTGLRNRPLALRVLTSSGYPMRASDIVGRSLEKVEAKMAEVDTMRSAPEISPVDLILLPLEQIITIRKGTYNGLGWTGDLGMGVPDHNVTLARDHLLFPLTIGFIRQFSTYQLVNDLLAAKFNMEGRNKSDELLSDLSIDRVLNLLEMINSSLQGDIRLKLPAEAVLSVFFRQDEFKESIGRAGHMLMTASSWPEIRPEETDLEIEPGKTGMLVSRYGFFDPGDETYKIGRSALFPESQGNHALLLEVVPKVISPDPS